MWLPWGRFRIKGRVSRGVAILDLKGKIVGPKAGKTLSEHMNRLLAANKKKIGLNLKKLRRIDNHGAAAFLAAYKLTEQKRGELKLVSPRKEVRKVLDKVLLTVFIDVCPTEKDALNRF